MARAPRRRLKKRFIAVGRIQGWAARNSLGQRRTAKATATAKADPSLTLRMTMFLGMLTGFLGVTLLAAVVGGGFGVDEEAGDFGGFEFEGVFEGGDYGVDLGHGQGVGQGAVAVDLDAVVDAGDEDVVDVEDLGEGFGDAAEAEFEVAVVVE
jgi:hypothetical protein